MVSESRHWAVVINTVTIGRLFLLNDGRLIPGRLGPLVIDRDNQIWRADLWFHRGDLTLTGQRPITAATQAVTLLLDQPVDVEEAFDLSLGRPGGGDFALSLGGVEPPLQSGPASDAQLKTWSVASGVLSHPASSALSMIRRHQPDA